MKLFKYLSVSQYSLSSIANEFCWWSSPSDFNDPFDSNIIDSEYLRKEIYSKHKIYCLSEVNDSLLMWSHYSDSHKGFCLEFSDYTDDELISLKQKGIYPNDDNSDLLIIRNANKVEYKSSKEIDNYIKDIPIDKEKHIEKYKSLNSSQKRKYLEKIKSTLLIKHMIGNTKKNIDLLIVCKKIFLHILAKLLLYTSV